jgi:copper(I)-binding protein
MKKRIVLATLTAVALALGPVSLAQAHNSPKPGTRCAMSGMATTVHSKTYVCRNANGRTTWSRGLPESRSALTAKDTWAKAADQGMTAVFGVISNPTNRPIRVIAATSPFSPTQLHEVVMADGAMKMQEMPRGFVIPARGQLELKPGGDHIMLMKLSRPIKAGTKVPVTLVASTGALASFTALGKPFAGANEEYDPHGGHGSGM